METSLESTKLAVLSLPSSWNGYCSDIACWTPSPHNLQEQPLLQLIVKPHQKVSPPDFNELQILSLPPPYLLSSLPPPSSTLVPTAAMSTPPSTTSPPQAQPIKQVPPKWKTLYLVLYNFLSATLWSAVLGRVVLIVTLHGIGKVFLGVGDYVRWVQTLAGLEVVHSLVGTFA